MLVMCLMSSVVAMASYTENNFYVEQKTTSFGPGTEYMEFWVCYYNSEGSDSYIPANDYFVVWYDYEEICSTKKLSGEDNDERENKGNLVYDNTVITTKNGKVRITINKYDDGHSSDDDESWALVRIYPEHVQWNVGHYVQFGANYKINQGTVKNFVNSFTVSTNVPVMSKDNTVMSSPRKGVHKFNNKFGDTTYEQEVTLYKSDRKYSVNNNTVNWGWASYSDNTNDYYGRKKSGGNAANQNVEIEFAASCYNPIKVYPRNRIKGATAYVHDVVTAPYTVHFPKAKNVQITSDYWNKTVSLKWDKEWNTTSLETLSKDGKWMITRHKDGEKPEYVKHVDFDKQEYTIPSTIDTEYDTEYTYTVSFVPNSWGTNYQAATTDLLDEELSASKKAKMTRNFAYSNVSVVQKGGKVQVAWTCTPVALNKQTEFTVYRIINGGTPVNVGTVSTEKNSGSYSFQDDIVNLADQYEYYVEAEFLDSKFTSQTVEAVLEGYSHITDLSATKGAYNDNVTLIWEVEQSDESNTYFKIERRVHNNFGEDETQWKLLANMQGQDDQYTYVDTKAQNGIFYDYRVTSFCKNSLKQVRCEKAITDLGFCSQTGTISGKISYDGGTAVDSVRVVLERIASEGETVSKEASLNCSYEYDGMQWRPNADMFKSLFSKGAYTMQMYLYPDSAMQVDKHKIMGFGESTFKLGNYDAAKDEFKLMYGKDDVISGNISYQSHNIIKRRSSDCLELNAASRAAHNFEYQSCSINNDYFYTYYTAGSYAAFDLSTSGKTNNLGIAVKLSKTESGYLVNVDVDGEIIGSYTLINSPQECIENDRYYRLFEIPESLLVDSNGNAKDKLRVKLTAANNKAGANIYEVRLVNIDTDYFAGTEVPGITIPNKKYSHLTFALEKGTMNVTRISKVQIGNGFAETDSIQTASFADNCFDSELKVPMVYVGDKFRGYVDDVRLFRRALKQNEIIRDFNHYLSGKEKDLVAYWPFDDGILGTGYAYDHSFTSGDANNNHAIVMAGCELNGIIPNTTELSFSAVTDANGDYIIQGVPYFEGGTNYNVRPMLGIHDFSPATKTCYFSDNSLVFNGNDFTDKSSFPVNGVVYYENTNHPVEGLTVYIDEAPAIRDGELVTTGKDGTFEINVPIGNHYIQVKQVNHDMMNNGRWPAAGTHLFDREVRDLTFTDQTLVTVAGRIDGGAIEYEKPLGMAASENNIGKAVITLTSEYYLNAAKQTTGLSSIFVPGKTEREFSSPTMLVESTAKTGKDTENGVKTITITTDPKTGEFAVKLPPVNYEIKSIVVPSNPDLVFEGVQFPVALSATNVDIVYTDSLQDETETWKYFDYKTKYKLAYRTKPVLSVTQKGNSEGFYGEPTYDYKFIAADGAEPEDRQLPLFRENEETHEVEYTYGAPIFYQHDKYSFDIRGYEMYTNYDGNGIKETEVPLQDVSVTVSNEMSNENYIMYSTGEISEVVNGTFKLDSLGMGTYQFRAGYPRAQAPYTLSMSMTYKAGDVDYSWEAPGFDNKLFKGIVLGQLPYGNNFVTAGTDKLLMILRDPPGSHSTTSWNEGVVTTLTDNYDNVHYFEEHAYGKHGIATETKLTIEQMAPTGTITGVISTSNKTYAGGSLALNLKEEWANHHKHSRTFGTTRTISTSSDPMYDGPDADLYIGVSQNYLFGMAKKIGFKYQSDGTMKLGDEDILTMGDSLKTTFVYTKYYIENTLIPNFRMMRNSMILPKGSKVEKLEKYYKYVSDVPDDDPNFGTKGYYHTVGGVVEKDKALLDSISWYNSQIDTWEGNIRSNEKTKVQAIQDSNAKNTKNYSLSSGGSISVTKQDTHSGSYTYNFNITHSEDVTIDFETAPLGFTLSNSIGAKHQSNYSWSDTEVNDTINTFSYTLADGDPEDALTIDVIDAPDGFSPIFYTRAGQTSGNWEPGRVTEYYEPGKHEIMAQTMKNMVPKIYAVSNSQITNVPITGKAIMKVTLCNESETNVGGLFKLGMCNNPAGCDVRCNGVPLTSGSVSYYLGGQYGKMDVTIEVSSVDKSILECDLGIRLTDATQSDPLGPYPRNSYDFPFKVTFVPASSEISLEADRAILNGNDDGKVNLTLRDYDLNLDNLMNIALEYRGESDSNWKTCNAWSCNASDKSSETVLDKSSVSFALDMTDTKTFPDQKYYFRARTMSNFGGEKVYNYSEEVTMLKDIEAPRLVGNPSPSDGTYKYNTEVYATFNEDIRSELINKLDNISLIGQLNDGKISHEVSLQCNGQPYCTEAKLPMPNTTFSLNTWVKWNGGEGCIFAHGTTSTNLAFGVAGEEHMNMFYMKIGEDIYLSHKPLPKDEWVFLSVVYDATDEENRKIICDYATADSNGPVSLIAVDSVRAAAFTAAKITMGHGFHGNIHDLSIWHNARSFAEANSQKDKRISKFAPNLVAYWPMNNGHGGVANELLHEANLVLNDENCWHLENENYSLRLESEDRVRIVPSSTASTNDSEDYLLQVWMRADEAQAEEEGNATILSIDNGKTALMLDRQTGALSMRCINGTMAPVSQKDMRDGKWHNFAIMAHKSTNANATLYLDGNNVGHVSAAQVSNIIGPIYIGNGFRGYVDELRVVKGMFTESTIKESMYVRYDTGNSRMLLYYPFEVTEPDDYGQPATSFSAVDRGVYGEGENRMVAAYDGRVHDPLSYSGTVAPPLLSTPIMQNVKYDLVVSDRRVSLVITESPERIEGCTLVASLRNIQDKAGNVIEPVTWLFNVNHDFIGWKEKIINDKISIDENMTAGVAIEKHIRNNTGYEKEWSLESVPYWMIPSQTGGVLKPNEELAITFNVLPSIGKGLHTGVIYLVEGATGISHPINYELINHGDIPAWEVNKENYSNTMNIIAQVMSHGVKQEGVYNMVGAFNAANECIGVATPTYEPRYDTYYYYLTIYGNAHTDTPIRFAYYDSQVGIVYPDVDILMPYEAPEEDYPVTFTPNKIIGSLVDPLLLQSNSKIEQSIVVYGGWNWISFNTMGSTPLDELFGEMTMIHDEDAPVCYQIINEENFSVYDDANGWSGTLADVKPGTMYKVNMAMPNKIVRIGEPANDHFLSHRISTGWNWLGATVSNTISLTSAMADMNPQEGDVIKNFETMSYFTGGGWVGPLKSIVPGVGYYYNSNDTEAKDFIYPTNAVMMMLQNLKSQKSLVMNPQPRAVSVSDYPAKRKYTGTMTIVASIQNRGVTVGNAELQAYDEEGEMRGINITQDSNNDLVFIVLHGDEAGDLTFDVVVGEGTEAKTYKCSNMVTFEDGKSLGTVTSPYVLDLDEATAINGIRGIDTTAPIYDITGRRVLNTNTRGIYIQNNKKVAVP